MISVGQLEKSRVNSDQLHVITDDSDDHWALRDFLGKLYIVK